jgi:hypothetical protein
MTSTLAAAEPTSLSALRKRFAEASPPHAVLSAALPETLLEEARSAASLAKYKPFFRPLRGRYEIADTLSDEPLLQRLGILASAVANVRLTALRSEWLRLRHRSYALSADDASAGEPRITHELILDASAELAGASEADGPIVYQLRDEPFFVVPRHPGALSLVARTPLVTRHTRYVTQRMGNATLTRLVIAFGVA